MFEVREGHTFATVDPKPCGIIQVKKGTDKTIAKPTFDVVCGAV